MDENKNYKKKTENTLSLSLSFLLSLLNDDNNVFNCNLYQFL